MGTLFLDGLPDALPHVCEPVGHLTLLQARFLGEHSLRVLLDVRVFGVNNEPLA